MSESNSLEQRPQTGVDAGSQDNGKHTFSSAQVFREIARTFQEIAPWYEQLGSGGFLIVASITIVFLTIGFSFLTGTDQSNPSALGINFQEEILYTGIAAIFAALGIFSVHRKNAQISSEKLKLLEVQIEDQRFQRDYELKKLSALANIAQSEPRAKAQLEKSIENLGPSSWHD